MRMTEGHRSNRCDWFCYTVATIRGQPRVYSGATNNVDRRVRLQHNQRRAGGSHTVRGWGPNNARLLLLIGPLARAQALSLERRLKNTLIRGGGIQGRLKALVRVLEAPEGLRSKSVQLTVDALHDIPVHTPLSREQVAGLVGINSDALALIGNLHFSYTCCQVPQ